MGILLSLHLARQCGTASFNGDEDFPGHAASHTLAGHHETLRLPLANTAGCPERAGARAVSRCIKIAGSAADDSYPADMQSGRRTWKSFTNPSTTCANEQPTASLVLTTDRFYRCGAGIAPTWTGKRPDPDHHSKRNPRKCRRRFWTTGWKLPVET
jgi:hypothetical protein